MANQKDPIEMTLEDFANWILALPDSYKGKKIWYIDITMPYKGKGLNVEESPTKEYIAIEDSKDPES